MREIYCIFLKEIFLTLLDRNELTTRRELKSIPKTSWADITLSGCKTQNHWKYDVFFLLIGLFVHNNTTCRKSVHVHSLQSFTATGLHRTGWAILTATQLSPAAWHAVLCSALLPLTNNRSRLQLRWEGKSWLETIFIFLSVKCVAG